MAVQIKMPQLSDTMESGKILVWRKNEGDNITRGDILAEVETEKANLEIESFNKGVLLKILVPADTTAKVGEVIAIIGDPGEIIENEEAKNKSPETCLSKTDLVSENETEKASVIEEFEKGASYPSKDRLKASPLAKKIADQLNVDLKNVSGSGPGGRILKEDVERTATKGNYEEIKSNNIEEQVQYGVLTGILTPLSKMRETIAKRMEQSTSEIPHFYVTVSVEMDETEKLRSVLKDKPEFHGINITHFIVKAAAYALEHERRVNSCYREGQVFSPDEINIGVVTAVDDGLLIPVLKKVNALTLREVVTEARALIERSRSGRPSSSDLVGGTFSISNMGMFDIEHFTAIINPGQGAILSISAIRDQAVVQNGVFLASRVMRATLSVDHRIIDGVVAAQFLRYFKEVLETPALLLV